MQEYYIEDDEGAFWCENGFGYWSKFESSKKHRFQGILIWVLPLYLIMKLSGVNCILKKIR